MLFFAYEMPNEILSFRLDCNHIAKDAHLTNYAFDFRFRRCVLVLVVPWPSAGVLMMGKLITQFHLSGLHRLCPLFKFLLERAGETA